MILTCPDCATRYFVREGAIPDSGRKVRCVGCAHVWLATSLDLSADEASAPGDAGSAPRSPLDTSEMAETPTLGTFEVEPPLPARIRARVQARRETREAVAAGVVWAVLCAGFALVLVAAVLFKVQVVRMFPATAGAYAAIRMPVNPVGLSLESVQGGPGLSNGRAVLVVSGVERNVETETRPPAPVRIALFDRTGKRVREQIARVEGPPLAPGETRAFSVNLYDPPINVAEYQVEFIVEKTVKVKVNHPRASRTAVPASHHPLPLRGVTEPMGSVGAAVPVEARPLPPGSPFALPSEGKLRTDTR
jgi:predicted Zn finger-like uncharacterized protein